MLVVTGATGLLGNVLLRGLTARGAAPVRALVRPSRTSPPSPASTWRPCLATCATRPLCSRRSPAPMSVFHLAGIVSIERGGLPRLHETNVEGTRNVLAACRETGVRRLVHCSSIHAFVVPQGGACLTEASPIDPDRAQGAYDRTKAEATLLVLEAVRQGLDAVMVFPTGVIGPYDFRPSHTGELVLAAAQGRLGAYVDGAYNFVDVRDVAQGLMAAAEKGRSGEGYILAATT